MHASRPDIGVKIPATVMLGVMEVPMQSVAFKNTSRGHCPTVVLRGVRKRSKVGPAPAVVRGVWG